MSCSSDHTESHAGCVRRNSIIGIATVPDEKTTRTRISETHRTIEYHRGCLSQCTAGSAGCIENLTALAAALHHDFRHRGGVHLLDEAIFHLKTALELQELRSLEHAAILEALGSALQDRHMQTGMVADLDQAISLCRAARDIRMQYDSDTTSSLLLMGTALTTRCRYHPFSDDGRIEEAIVCLRRCLESTSNDAAQSISPSIGLSEVLELQYWATGRIDLLEEDINVSRSAVRAASSMTWSPDHSLALIGLGNALAKRFVKTGSMQDMEEAERMFAESYEQLSITSSPDRWRPLCAWADALIFRGVKVSSVDTISKATTLARQASDLCPPNHFYRTRVIVVLATSEHHQYNLAGSEDLLHHSITLYRECISLCPTREMPECVVAISNLSSALRYRYRIMDQAEDLDSAIEFLTDCIERVPRYYAGFFNLIQNLANLYGARFKALERESDSQTAIRLRRETLELCPLTDVRRPLYLANLAYSLHSAAEKLGKIECLPEAAAAAREAIEAVPSQNRFTYASLGTVLRAAWERGMDPNGLQDAIELHQSGVATLPPGHPIFAEKLADLGDEWFTKYRATEDAADLARSMQAYRDAVSHESSWIRDRFDAALQWIERATEAGDVSCISEAYRRALALLPGLVYLHLSPTQRLQSLKFIRRLPGLVQSAALHFLAQDMITTAIELLEEGRGVFWAQMMRLRDHQGNQNLPANLASRLTEIAAKLEARSIGSGPMEDEAATRRQITLEFDRLVELARKHPGCESFLKPLSFEQLCLAAAEGPVIILVAHDSRAEAIVIPSASGDAAKVTLSISPQRLKIVGDFMYAESRNARHTSSTANDRTELEQARLALRIQKLRPKHDPVQKLLSELWHGVVQPVIQALGLEPAQGRDRPRLWWVPTGAFLFLPVHAAGIYSGPEPVSLSDFAVSSYSPNIGTLLEARGRSRRISASDARVLLVTQPDAPGLGVLPNIVAEAEGISQLLPSTMLIRLNSSDDSQLTVEQTLSACPQVSILHLACHGQQNSEDALDSGFVLKDGKLTVSALMQLHLPHAFFAFLSACESAKGDTEQPDEVINLSAAMMFAGFKSVIGTMWSMNDADGPSVARQVYEALLDGSEILDPRVIPYALDSAARELRESGASPIRWATYIHMGI